MLQSFKYSEIKWTRVDGIYLILEIRTRDSKSDKNSNRPVKVRTKQAGLIETLMKKMKDMHAQKDRHVNIVYSLQR